MGTLMHQERRNKLTVTESNVAFLLEDAQKLAKKYKVDIAVVLEAYRIKEMERQNDLYVENGDVHDEQMTGFGKLIETFNGKMDFICNLLEDRM